MRFAITVSFVTLCVGLVTSQGPQINAPKDNTFTLVRRTIPTVVTQTNVTATIPKSNLAPVLTPPVGLRDALENVHRIHNEMEADAVNNDHSLVRRNITIVARPPPQGPPKPVQATTVPPNHQTKTPPTTSPTKSANSPQTTTVTTTSPAKPASAPPPSSQLQSLPPPPPTNQVQSLPPVPPTTQVQPLSLTPPTSQTKPPPTTLPTSSANPPLTTTVTTTSPAKPVSPPPPTSQVQASSRVTLSPRQDKKEATAALPARLPTDATTCAAILKKMKTSKASSAGTKSASSRRGFNIPATYSYPLSRRAPQSGDTKPSTSGDDPCAKLAAIAQKVKSAVGSAL
ncbi:uncharacterized protein MELLADRAFT_59375 [Melampsora larici-populina 98AG31]|uniref:Secreted protein n=1 Tax=Melampsora larici-populina (strain 98AG31 / pathotype 3-4-7) TaxID=747676 RepID=F4R629_MELLP|nr:uncharacterized protein MELLADRAFT_59375 [Melampsora larici-populina 98AG31]EGG12147.1 secreted protein [Melampsora larici-populina 98AG31]